MTKHNMSNTNNLTNIRQPQENQATSSPGGAKKIATEELEAEAEQKLERLALRALVARGRLKNQLDPEHECMKLAPSHAPQVSIQFLFVVTLCL
jgi:hypothetical protein